MSRIVSDHRLLDRMLGIDIITVKGYDGELGDPVAAWIKIDNCVRLWIVVSPDRAAWGAAKEAAFQEAVRLTAATYPGLPATGTLSALFDPPQVAKDDGSTPRGESIMRLA